MLSLNVPLSIPFKDIADLFVTGLEGGYSPWLGSISYPKIPEGDVDDGVVRYSHETFWGGEFLARFTFDGGNDDEGSFASTKEIGPAELAAGLVTFAKDQPAHFADFINEQTDAETGDVFLQMLLLGEVIYG